MALYGSFEGKTANEYITPKITWTAVQSIPGNYSDITATLTYSRTNAGFTTEGYWTGSLSIGTNTKNATGVHIKVTQNSNTVAITHTARVAHAEDGTLKITISATGANSKGSLSATAIAKEITLDTIPRTSSITSAGAVTLGEACSVGWTPNSADFRFKLKFALGGWEHITEAIHPNTTGSYTYTGYTLPLEVAEQFTDSDRAEIAVTLTTYTDSQCKNQTGSVSSSFTVTVPQNSETQPEVTMVLTAQSPLEGIYLQGVSWVSADLSAEGRLGASIEGYTLSAEGRSYEAPYKSRYLTRIGEQQITGCATDSRGIPGYAMQTIRVYPYSKPGLTDVSVYRCTSDGTADDSGEYLRIKATRRFSRVEVDGERRNYCSISYRYRAETADSWSEYVCILEENEAADTVQTEPLLNATLYKDRSYIVELKVTDSTDLFTTVTVGIPSEKIFRHKRAGGRGLGLGGYCQEDDLLEVYWDQRLHGALNGQYIRSVSGEKGGFKVQSCFEDFSGSSWTDGVQYFLIAGCDMNHPVLGVILVSAGGGIKFETCINSSVNVTVGEAGCFTVSGVWACLKVTLISTDPFEIIEEE